MCLFSTLCACSHFPAWLYMSTTSLVHPDSTYNFSAIWKTIQAIKLSSIAEINKTSCVLYVYDYVFLFQSQPMDQFKNSWFYIISTKKTLTFYDAGIRKLILCVHLHHTLL